MFWGSGGCLIRRGLLILTQPYIFFVYIISCELHPHDCSACSCIFEDVVTVDSCHNRIGSLATPATVPQPFHGQGASSAPGALLCCRCFLCCGNGKTSPGFSFTGAFRRFSGGAGRTRAGPGETPRSREEMPWPHHEGHHPIRFHDWTNNRLYLNIYI